MNTFPAIRCVSFATILLAGCTQSPSSADAQRASTPAAQRASAPAGSALPHGVTTAFITDPSFNNMQAGTLTIPSGWKLQGIIMTAPCTPAGPVFRAYSADGLTEMRNMPALGWAWSANGYKTNTQACMQMSKPLTATEFLDHYVETIPGGVHVVGPMPVPEAFRQRVQRLADQANAGNANVMQPLRSDNTGDAAALRVETVNGSFVIEQRLLAEVECSVNNNTGALKGGHCYGVVSVLRAPKGRLDALAQFVDSNHLPDGKPSQEWIQAMQARQQRQGQAAMDALTRQEAQERGAMNALTRQEQQESNAIHQQYEQFRDTQQRSHEAFMAQQESQFHSAMNNANNSMNARSTATSDWVDYALDQQTVTGQGGTQKVSSAYSQTWSSTVGNQTQWYQTNDPNANPNGVLSGNWTPDTKVHGNGQSY